MRKVPTDSSYALRGDALKKMVDEDKAAGLIPFYVRPQQCICPVTLGPDRKHNKPQTGMQYWSIINVSDIAKVFF